jgi:peroxiredoxin
VHRRQALIAATFGLAVAELRAAGVITEWKGSRPAPPLDLLTPDGAPLSLAAMRGKVVVVNFWATWCEPCVAEMPSLQQLRDRLAPRLEVLGVNHQEGPARIRAFVDKNRITFPVVRDTDGATAKAWSVRIFPASFVVDRAGHVKHVVVGQADWTSAGLLSTIDPLL